MAMAAECQSPNAPNPILFALNQINGNSANNGGGVDADNATSSHWA